MTKYDEELKSLLHEAWNTGFGEALGESTSQGLSFAEWYASNMPAHVDSPKTHLWQEVDTHLQLEYPDAYCGAGGRQLVRVTKNRDKVDCEECLRLSGTAPDWMKFTTYSGVGADDRGIFLHPAAWNCERLPGRDEALLAYFFKLVYMERVAQGKRGLRRHDYAEWLRIFREVPKALTALVAGLREGRLTDEVLEPAQVQTAASLAAWHADMCQRVWEAEDTEVGEHERTIAEGPLISREALDEQMRGMG